ncbi:MAG: protein kinase [Myxococcales bacterium]|nr:protein kinase [Myxococcales bacterium]
MSGLGRHPDVGDKLGRYTLDAPLGAGGMASVFRAIDPHGDPYAVKVLNPARVLPEDVKRFQREFKALSRMDHPNIVRVYESGVHEGYPWIAMELVDGGDLEGLIDRWKANPPPDRFERIEALLVQLCKALQYVHDRRLIHRDIKPSNVLLTPDGVPRLSDFGVVKGGADGTTHITQLTMAGRLVGTVAFMAPELITSDEDADARADLYSLGAMLYLMLCFRRPIEAKSVAGYLARHLTEIPVPPGQLDPDVPPVLERVAMRLLQKDRAHRYASASAVLAALGGEAKATRPTLQGRERELQGWSRRVGALVDGAGGCVVLNGAEGTGKSHLMTVMVEAADASSVKVLYTSGWDDDPLETLATQVGLDPEGSIGGALGRAILATLLPGPAVLAIDDLDRAPRRTIDALARTLRQLISQEGQPILLLASARSLDAISDLVTGTATGMPADLIPVGPVDSRAAVSMMRDRGILGAAASVLGRRLHTSYGGVPGPMLDQLDALLRDGWFTGGAERLELARSMTELRQGELPVPQQLADALLARLERVRNREREILELLAVVDRPAGASLLARCTDDPGTARTLDELVGERWLELGEDETAETFTFRDPIAARVLRGALDPARRQELHGIVAGALGGRRRRATANLEVAQHLDAAGRPAEAYPIYVAAAKRSAKRDGLPLEVLDVCERADAIREAVEPSLPQPEAMALREEPKALEGRARLARQDWQGALTALKLGLSTARSNGSDGEAALLADLGRAWFRLGDRRRAQPALEEALEKLEPSDASWAPGMRALGDILLTGGQYDAAEARVSAALERALEVADRDGEARARRGLAHVRVFQGRLPEAAQLLDEADDLLALDGDAQVRAAVLSRAIEVANMTGHWGNAVRRAEQLVDVARRRELSARLPDAYSLLALALLAIGATDEALDAASQARVFAKAHRSRVEPQLRTARALLDLGRHAEAEEVLPERGTLPDSGIDDPPGLHAALRARILAPENPTEARDLAIWALKRPPPMLSFRAAIVALDASKALLEVGQTSTARKAAKRGLKCLQGLGADGLRLEVLLALQRAEPDARVQEAIAQVAGRVAGRLAGPALDTFQKRDAVRAALG